VLGDVALGRIEVVLDLAGRPSLDLHGEVREAVGSTLGEVELSVSLTHEDRMAAAVVLVEVPERSTVPAR